MSVTQDLERSVAAKDTTSCNKNRAQNTWVQEQLGIETMQSALADKSQRLRILTIFIPRPMYETPSQQRAKKRKSRK